MPGRERRRARVCEAAILRDRGVGPSSPPRALHRDVRDGRRRRDRRHRRDRGTPAPPASPTGQYERNRDPDCRVRRGLGQRRKHTVEQRRMEPGHALERRHVEGVQPAQKGRVVDPPLLVGRNWLCVVRHGYCLRTANSGRGERSGLGGRSAGLGTWEPTAPSFTATVGAAPRTRLRTQSKVDPSAGAQRAR